MAADLTFGLGLGVMALLAVMLLVLGMYGGKTFGKQAGKLMMAFGAIFAILAVLTYAGAGGYLQSGEPATIAESAIYDVSVSESEGEVYAYASEHRIVVAMSFNDTSNAFVSSTGVFTLNWTLARADSMTTDSVAKLSLGNVPSVDVSGSANEYIMDDNSDGTWNALFTKAGGITSYETANVLVEAGSSAWCSVVFTLNSAAVAEMSQYESVNMPITVGGETWTIVLEKAIIST
jgi:hypothetical protein